MIKDNITLSGHHATDVKTLMGTLKHRAIISIRTICKAERCGNYSFLKYQGGNRGAASVFKYDPRLEVGTRLIVVFVPNGAGSGHSIYRIL